MDNQILENRKLNEIHFDNKIILDYKNAHSHSEGSNHDPIVGEVNYVNAKIPKRKKIEE